MVQTLYRGYPRPMKAHTRMMMDVEKASFFVAKRARTCVRLTFSRRRRTAAAAVVDWDEPVGSQARMSSTVTGAKSAAWALKLRSAATDSWMPCHFDGQLRALFGLRLRRFLCPSGIWETRRW